MHRSGGVAGGGGGGAAAGRGLELEHPPTMPTAPAGFHWGAMIAGHHAAAAAGMMQPPLSAGADYSLAGAHGGGHPAMPMDLHVSQGFPCYRCLSKRTLATCFMKNVSEYKMKLFHAVVLKFFMMKYFYLILIWQLLFVRAGRNIRNSYSSSEESNFSDDDLTYSISESDKVSPLSNIKIGITISSNQIEYLHLKRTYRVLANEYLPVWVIKGKVDERSIKKNGGYELKPQYGVMKRVGKFTFYQDRETSSSAVYFHRHRQFDGMIDTRYLIRGLSLDKIDPAFETIIELGESGIISRLPSMEHPPYISVTNEVAVGADENEYESESEVAKTHESRIYDGYPEILVIVSFDLAKELFNDNQKSDKYTRVVSYILTLFNGADMLYSKLKETNIKLNIAGIIIASECDSLSFLKHCYDNSLNENNDHTNHRLDAVCTNKMIRQYLYSRADVIPFDSYDAVIFLTKNLLYEVKDGVEETLEGSSSVMSIYNEKKMNRLPISVATVRDDRDYGSYGTVAHELAHLMSVKHDTLPFVGEKEECCLNIMKITGTYWCKNCLSWSDKSEETFKTFFSSVNCCGFINVPRSLYSPKPKKMLNADEQCQCYGFKCAMPGKKIIHQYCSSSLQCQNENGDVDQTVFPMDGTPCGINKVCWGWTCDKIDDDKLSHCRK